ncbi:hypothetical protein TSUD_336080 [Trifolium subterraneum]|uniref:Uncharacterized protein n=1 Tax=Trifolium subterraneum TaxID=3900 RepID=A0A2Z6LMN3_TRISU|nr:hypothetical protein TSUD_336080 [Trifolium subterraneum]
MVDLSHIEKKEENLKDRKKKMITPPRSEFLDYIQDDKGKQNLDKEVIKSKKKQLLESDVYAKELMVNLFHLEKKEENLKDRKKKIITPPPPSPSKKVTRRVYVVEEDEEEWMFGLEGGKAELG